jgi:hypothetical protein
MNRKIIQLQAFETNGGRSTEIWLLCDDGTLWRNGINDDGSATWKRVDTSALYAAAPIPPPPRTRK